MLINFLCFEWFCLILVFLVWDSSYVLLFAGLPMSSHYFVSVLVSILTLNSSQIQTVCNSLPCTHQQLQNTEPELVHYLVASWIQTRLYVIRKCHNLQPPFISYSSGSWKSELLHQDGFLLLTKLPWYPSARLKQGLGERERRRKTIRKIMPPFQKIRNDYATPLNAEYRNLNNPLDHETMDHQ